MPTANCGFDSSGPLGSVLLTFNGPTLAVDIGFDPSYSPTAIPHKNPVLSNKGVSALVDTGAGECCIDSGLAMQLNLPIVDRKPIAGAHGVKDVNIHLAQIYIPALDRTIYGQFAAVDLIAGGQSHQALIGRSFLQHVTMVYEGKTGAVTLKIESPAPPDKPA